MGGYVDAQMQYLRVYQEISSGSGAAKEATSSRGQSSGLRHGRASRLKSQHVDLSRIATLVTNVHHFDFSVPDEPREASEG